MSMTDGNGDSERIYRDKDLVFYGSLVNAWVTTKMERDKTLVVLSSAGFGLVVTVLCAADGLGCLEYSFASVSLLSFLVCFVVCVWVFDKNGTYIESIINGESSDDTTKTLKRCDKITMWSFVIGMLAFLMFAISVSGQG